MAHEISFGIGLLIFLYFFIQFILNLFMVGFTIVCNSIINKEYKYSFSYVGFVLWMFFGLTIIKLSYNADFIRFLENI